jgi:hypothetical protein
MFHCLLLTPQGRKELAGTAATSYGSEGWGSNPSERAKSAGHGLMDRRLMRAETEFGTTWHGTGAQTGGLERDQKPVSRSVSCVPIDSPCSAAFEPSAGTLTLARRAVELGRVAALKQALLRRRA